MLYEFLTANKADLIARCKVRTDQRSIPKGSDGELDRGIPLFFDQLIKTLEAEQASEKALSIKVSGDSGGKVPEHSEIGATAARHGRELSRQGFSFDQVIRSYGDICQVITELAVERKASIDTHEFKTLNRCLDNATADAITEFAFQQGTLATDRDSRISDERVHVLLQDLRKHLHSATLAIAAIKAGNVGLGGVTGTILDLSLVSMKNLLERPLAAVQPTARSAEHHQPIPLAGFINEIKTFTTPEARARKCKFTVPEVDKGLEVYADRDMLFSVLGSLLENAFKFTHPLSEVSLDAYTAGDRILIDVEDNCGGLAPGLAEKIFLAPKQNGDNRPAFRHRLAICHRSIEKNGGTLSVRNIDGKGCVFTISLPRIQSRKPGSSEGDRSAA
jgi:signal transduction histidine kinase